MKHKYLWALDISLNCTGIVIFRNDMKPVFIGNINTSKCENLQMKLSMFGMRINELLQKYEPYQVVGEKGFYRFMASSEAIWQVTGVAKYLLADYPQEFYAPTTIKKLVGGKGSMKKDELAKVVLDNYCNESVKFETDDESDAYACGICYFKKI